MWRALPAPKGNQPELREAGCDEMRDFVVQLRKKIEPCSLPRPAGQADCSRTSQPFLMWKNRQYATHRTRFRSQPRCRWRAKPQPCKVAAPERDRRADDESAIRAAAHGESAGPAIPICMVPAGQRARYEAAFARFSAVFPDAFYISERGRYFPDNTRDKGRLLSAGFHNVMGYFRDDQPLYELILDEKGKKELDGFGRSSTSSPSADIRTYVQFYFDRERRGRDGSASRKQRRRATRGQGDHRPSRAIKQVDETYRGQAPTPARIAIAVKAIADHFQWVNDTHPLGGEGAHRSRARSTWRRC